MDFVKNLAGGGNQDNQTSSSSGEQKASSSSSGGGGGGLMDKLNNVAGGGAAGEKKEDGLDKGVDWVQQNVFKQGDQSNESALEQAKDEQISDFIRDKYKTTTGKDFPIADK